MTARCSAPQLVLKAAACALIASPLVSLFARQILDVPHGASSALVSQWLSELMPIIFGLWLRCALLYAIGFWLIYVLLKCGLLRRPARSLWWFCLAFGLLVASFVPFGTIVALPSLVVLFKKRTLFHEREKRAP